MHYPYKKDQSIKEQERFIGLGYTPTNPLINTIIQVSKTPQQQYIYINHN